MTFVGKIDSLSAAPVLTHWLGRSGRAYDLTAERLDSFVMQQTRLYCLTRGSEMIWIGSSDDLIGDAASRLRFRKAMAQASHVYSMPAPEAPHTAIWDLEGTIGSRFLSAGYAA